MPEPDPVREAAGPGAERDQAAVGPVVAAPPGLTLRRIEQHPWRLHESSYGVSDDGWITGTHDIPLIADGTYLVAEANPGEADVAITKTAGPTPVIAGCGGWSKRKTLYGSDRWTGREDSLLDPLRGDARFGFIWKDRDGF